MAVNSTVYYCVPVSLTVLGVFQTPYEAMLHLNNAASTVKERDVNITTTITDQSTMWFPLVVHLAVTVMGWTLRNFTKHQKDKQFNITKQGMFLVVGIQNPYFTVGQQSWRFETRNACPEQQQPGLNRHAITVIDGTLFHCDIHDGKLYRYPLKYLVGNRQEEQKYLVRI